MHKRNILIILALLLLAYANALFNGFVGDDNLLITNNTFYSSWKNFPRLFQSGYIFDWKVNLFSGTGDYGPGSVSYRPVDNATYFLDYWLWGLKAFGFHLTNILLHLANACLLYLLLVRWGIAARLALFAVLLFGLHPVESEAVCNIGYRADILASFFVLLSFYAWERKFYIFSFMGYFLAVFSKESAVTFPLLLCVYTCFIQKAKPKDFLNQIPFWLITFFYLYVYFFIFPNAALPSNPILGEDWGSHAAIMLKIWADYVAALIMPFVVHSYPALYAPDADLSWAVALKLCLALSFVVGSFLLIRTKIYRFCILWFIIFYIPVSNIIPLANPVALRFLYLPSMGLIVVLAFLLDRLFAQDIVTKISSRLYKILLTAVLTLCMVLTVLLNSSWNSTYLITLNWVKYYPQSWKANELMGILNFEKSNYIQAQHFLLKSLQYMGKNQDFRIYWYLGFCYLQLGQLDRAYLYFDLSTREFDHFSDGFYAMGEVLAQKKDYAGALDKYGKALDLNSRVALYYSGPMRVYSLMGNEQGTQDLLNKAQGIISEKEFKELQDLYNSLWPKK
jgi:hypothetical protein